MRVAVRLTSPAWTVAWSNSLPTQVDLPKPLGLRFARGNDGGAYITKNDPKLGNTDPRIQVYCVCTSPTRAPAVDVQRLPPVLQRRTTQLAQLTPPL